MTLSISRYFMREGWGETEDWGVWTIGRHAVLCIGFASPQAVVLRALVQPFLTKTHRRIEVRVSAGPRQVARWTFSLDSDAGDRPQWREALISTNKPLHHTYNFLCDRRANVSICRGDIR